MVQLYRMLFDRRFNFFFIRKILIQMLLQSSSQFLMMLFYLSCNSNFVLFSTYCNFSL